MILKLAFLSTLVVYVAVAYVIAGQGGEAAIPPETLQLMVYSLGGVFAVQAAFALFLVPRFARQSSRLVQMAIYEAGALMGLVLAILSHNPLFTVYFGVPAALLILITPSS